MREGISQPSKPKGKTMGQQKIYDMITERIVHALQDAIENSENGERAIAPWQKPWHETGMPQNLVSKKNYRGMNVFLLAMTPFESPYWVTYKQATQLGGKIKKGEKGCPVVFWKWIETKKDKEGNEMDKAKQIPFLRYYTVFNVEQTEGIDESKIPTIEKREFNPIAEGDEIIANMPNRPKMRHDEARAYYRPAFDIVNMPKHELFKSDSEYYSTAFHELVHATGHTSRLNRKEVMDGKIFGSHDYSIEELVAEMGSVFLCNEIGIEATFDNSLAYLKSWLGKLKDDTKMLITASGRAQKAVDYILNNKPETKGSENKPTE